MMFKRITSTCIMLFFAVLCSSGMAFAQDKTADMAMEAAPATVEYLSPSSQTGLDLRTSITIPYFLGASIGTNAVKALEGVGIGIDIQLLYRWTHCGIGIQQQLGGVFSLANVQADSDSAQFSKGDGTFIGGTYFIVKEYIPLTPEAMITFTEGIGAVYGTKSEKRAYLNASGAAFSFRLELGFTYFILAKYGVGIHVEYSGALAADSGGISYSQSVIPMLSYEMIF